MSTPKTRRCRKLRGCQRRGASGDDAGADSDGVAVMSVDIRAIYASRRYPATGRAATLRKHQELIDGAQPWRPTDRLMANEFSRSLAIRTRTWSCGIRSCG